MKVVSYLAGIPPSNKNPEKEEMLRLFIQGVIASGDRGYLHTGRNLIDCDVAFIQGWQHEHGKSAPHLALRQQVIDYQRTKNKRLLVVDSNLFNYRGHNSYHRYSFDGVFPTTGTYFWNTVDPLRWQQISRDTGIVLQAWRTSGSHILICTQRNGGWSMQGQNVVTWLDQTIANIRQYSDRPIRIRAHPGDKSAAQYLANRGISKNVQLVDDFANAWAVVTYNSTPAVAAAIEGIPAFITDPQPANSQAHAVANTDLSQLESPLMPDRQLWIEKLAMCHWSKAELASGAAWRHFRQYV